ncbi:MAG TPA: DUF2817 domain-containing protein [Gaiellaceae bacterium]|nr:DUF2817 domain-containing protein [Gaiellaceae bacterium]
MLRGLILVAAVALGSMAGDARVFENRVYGHAVDVPSGWIARQEPENGTTNVLTYSGARFDRLGQPPPGQVRVIILDSGRFPCSRGAIREGSPIRLGSRTSFEGFTDGYSIAFCRGGHSFQALIPVGRGASPARVEEARAIVESVRLTPRANEVGNVHSVRLLGRSYEGRPIRAWRIGNPRSPRRLLIVGCIHGNECAGTAVSQRLVSLSRPIDLDLWVVQNLNPDGLEHGLRGNAHGIDLNRDFLAATQRETRVARKLILRLKPNVTIWFHQPEAVVRAWGTSRAAARRYAALARAPYRSIPWPPGSASRWQNGIGQTSFDVELPAGELPDAAARRYASAVVALAQ